MIQRASGADIISDAREAVKATVLLTVLPRLARDPVPAFMVPWPTLAVTVQRR
ncbi:hypothetical protein [Acidiphilium sp.]|uniref:hypothetical protein n=1 Tax=Acidiphilium sp. TaxID=527 RepID=UPI00258C5CB1|nr:hypothetical protein [Acidiphilium sp.]